MVWAPRYTALIVLFCAYLLCYLDRMAIATAIPFIAEDFRLSPLAMGSVLSAFFAGYSLMQIPGGLLADKLGPRRVMTAAVAGWSVFTAITATAASLPALLTIRVLFGLSEGPFPSAAAKAIAISFPPREVGRANGIQTAAVSVGAAIAPITVAPMILWWGWRTVFYVLFIPGLVMTLLVAKFIKDSPLSLPHDEAGAVQVVAKLPLMSVLRMPAVIWCALTLFLKNMAGWGLMNWIPTYLLQERGFSIAKMGIMASLPFLSGAVGYYLGGHISDKYCSRSRHLPILVGLIVAGVMTYVAVEVPSGEWAVVALAIGFLFLTIASAGVFTVPIMAVPREAVGAAFGIVNTVGQVAGFISPLLVGYVLGVSGGQFHWVFAGFATLFALAACSVLPLSRHLQRS